MTQETTPIIDLLSPAGAAHHTYEQTILQGAHDQNWPTCFAEYTIEHGLKALFQRRMTAEQLGRFFGESACRLHTWGAHVCILPCHTPRVAHHCRNFWSGASRVSGSVGSCESRRSMAMVCRICS